MLVAVKGGLWGTIRTCKQWEIALPVDDTEDKIETMLIESFAGVFHQCEAHQKIIDMLLEKQKELSSTIKEIAGSYPEATLERWIQVENARLGLDGPGYSPLEYEGGPDNFKNALRAFATSTGWWTPSVPVMCRMISVSRPFSLVSIVLIRSPPRLSGELP